MSSPSTAPSISNGVLTAAELVQSIDRDRRLAAEVLRKLPHMVTDEEDVAFEIEPTVTVPSLKKMGRQWQETGGQVINNRLDAAERTSINLISEVVRLAQMMNKSRLNPSWNPLDLTTSSDGDTSNPLYRANVDYGLRFPAAAKAERNPIYKTSSMGQVIGDWLIPNHSSTKIQRTLTNATSSTGSGAISYASIFKREVKTIRTYTSYHPPRTTWYGGYYQWRRTYSWASSDTRIDVSKKTYVPRYSVTTAGYTTSHSYTDISYVVPETLSLDGQYAFIGQSFYCDKAQVLLGVTLQVANYSASLAVAEPKFLLVRCKEGKPVLDDVLARGSSSTTGVRYSNYDEIQVTWDRPVFVRSNEQLAIVVGFKGEFQLSYQNDTDRTGGLYVCEDHYYWAPFTTVVSNYSAVSPNKYDLRYNLIVAQFENTDVVIDLQALELSGGISSAKLALASQNENDDDAHISFEIEHNSTWQTLDILDKNVDLPPFVNFRMRLSGSQDVMPLIHKTDTVITLFRPAADMRFISKPRQRQADNVRIVYELAGFNPSLHTTSIKLITNHQEILPTITTENDSDESVVKTVRAEFALPVGVMNYQIKIEGTTQNASIGFDVTSLIELV